MADTVLYQIIERVDDLLKDKNHADLCGCKRWPDECVTYPGGRRAIAFSVDAEDVLTVGAPLIAAHVQDAIAAEAKRMRDQHRADRATCAPEFVRDRTTAAAAYEYIRLFARQLGEVEARPGVPEVPFAAVLRDGNQPDTIWLPSLAADHVWVHPGLVHGRPCVAGTRLTVDTVARYVREDGVDAVRAAYPQLTRDRVLVACWYAARHIGNPFAGWWSTWSLANESPLWTGEFDKVADPPRDAPLPQPEDEWELATTAGPAKQWDGHPPPGEGWEPDPTRRADGETWTRYDYHEERHWRRRRTNTGAKHEHDQGDHAFYECSNPSCYAAPVDVTSAAEQFTKTVAYTEQQIAAAVPLATPEVRP